VFTASRCFGLRALDAAAAFFLPAMALLFLAVYSRNRRRRAAGWEGVELSNSAGDGGEGSEGKRTRKISWQPKGSAWAASWA
jgi:hypothetical protein